MTLQSPSRVPSENSLILTLAVKELHCQAVWPPCLTSYSPSTLSLSSSHTNLPTVPRTCLAHFHPRAFARAVPSAGTPWHGVSRWLISLSPPGYGFQALPEHPHLKFLPAQHSQVALVVKNPPSNKRCGFNSWVRKIPWRRAWQPTPVLLPGESHGQRSPAGYSPWGHQELDTTEVT